MNKKYSVFISALFCLFIFGFGIAQFILPDRDFSEQENRYLSQFRAPTLSTLRSGEFMEKFEDYVVDQFPMRDQWIHLKAWSERLLGKQENNSVYLGTDGQTLFAQYTRPSDSELQKRVGYVIRLGEKLSELDVGLTFTLIPDKSAVWADRLPANAPLVDDGNLLADAEAICAGKVNCLDLTGVLSGDDVFYRTDHHWTTFGAAQVAQAISRWYGRDAEYGDTNRPVMVSNRFYGTTYSSSGAAWVQPDEMYKWVDGDFRVTCYHSGKAVEYDSLYFYDNLQKKDKYTFFLGGNQPLCVIENDHAATNEKILLVRDSYSDTLAPFLAKEYAEVHLFDLRYNNTPISQYVLENGIDEVLVIYSSANFTTDGNLFKMGM